MDEYKKRRSRFIKEIEKVFSFQDSISGIIPICDSSVYDTAVDALQKLLDKRDAQRKDDLWKAIIKSEKSYEEILAFVTSDQKTED